MEDVGTVEEFENLRINSNYRNESKSKLSINNISNIQNTSLLATKNRISRLLNPIQDVNNLTVNKMLSNSISNDRFSTTPKSIFYFNFS